MYLLLSGEGPTDMGFCELTCLRCDGGEFLPGPMAWFVDQWVERKLSYSHIELGFCGLIPKGELIKKCKKELSTNGKSMGLLGKKRPGYDTNEFYKNARMLARLAQQLAVERNEPVIAVLFRDRDGTRSSSPNAWDEKWQSMLNGFQIENYRHGVPMIPAPKSEAWLLCAVENQYQHCAAIEKRSGNDRGLNPLKESLDAALGERATRDLLAEKVRNREIDIDNIDMPSLCAFQERLDSVVAEVLKGH